MRVPRGTPCHVCGRTYAVSKPAVDVPPTCVRNDCLLAVAGMISVAEARRRINAERLRREARKD